MDDLEKQIAKGFRRKENPTNTVKALWLEIISTLRDQLEEIKGHSNATVFQRIEFHRI